MLAAKNPKIPKAQKPENNRFEKAKILRELRIFAFSNTGVKEVILCMAEVITKAMMTEILRI